jgi:hypothetical protein
MPNENGKNEEAINKQIRTPHWVGKKPACFLNPSRPGRSPVLRNTMEIERSDDLAGWEPLMKSAPPTPYLCANCKSIWRARRVQGHNRCPNCHFIYTTGQLRRLAENANLVEGRL